MSNLTDIRPESRPSLIEGYTLEENRSQVVECKVQASQRELHYRFDETGTLRDQSEVSTFISADITVTSESKTKITFTPRLCYLAGGDSVDLVKTAAYETMVRLSRNCLERDHSGPSVSAAELPFRAGICDESGDPFYSPIPGCTPECVQKEIIDLVQFCATAVAEKDPIERGSPPRIRR